MKQIKILILLLLLIAVFGCQKTLPKESPESIINEYFIALNNKDYDKMYFFISEGFKQNEPTAKTIGLFAAYMEKFFEKADRIELKNQKIDYIDSYESRVSFNSLIFYKAELKEFNNTLTLRNKNGEWKLIHPYGSYKDLS